MIRVIEYTAKSLEVIRNDTLEYGVSPYYYFVVTISVPRTVSEIRSVKEWRDLEIRVRRHSRSLKAWVQFPMRLS